MLNTPYLYVQHVAQKIWCDFRDDNVECFDRGMVTLFRQLLELNVSKSPKSSFDVLAHGGGGGGNEIVSFKKAKVASPQIVSGVSKDSFPECDTSNVKPDTKPDSSLISALQFNSPVNTNFLAKIISPSRCDIGLGIDIANKLLQYGHDGSFCSKINLCNFLTIHGLIQLHSRDISAFHALVQQNFHCAFEDSLALSVLLQNLK
jgi:hypothetical protein